MAWPTMHAEGQRVAVAVVEQRLPVGDFLAGDLPLCAQAAGEAGGVAVAHAGHLDAVRDAAEPLLFVAPRGEQDLGLGGLGPA